MLTLLLTGILAARKQKSHRHCLTMALCFAIGKDPTSLRFAKICRWLNQVQPQDADFGRGFGALRFAAGRPFAPRNMTLSHVSKQVLLFQPEADPFSGGKSWPSLPK
jgi:hypothetical protein